MGVARWVVGAVTVLAIASCGDPVSTRSVVPSELTVTAVDGAHVQTPVGGTPVVLDDGRLGLVSFDETTLAVHALVEGRPRLVAATSFGATIVAAVTYAGPDGLSLAVQVCERPFDPNYDDIHPLCDGPSRIGYLELLDGSTTFTSVARVPATGDLVGIAKPAELLVVSVGTDRWERSAAAQGSWSKLPADVRFACVTARHLIGIPTESMATNTTVAGSPRPTSASDPMLKAITLGDDTSVELVRVPGDPVGTFCSATSALITTQNGSAFAVVRVVEGSPLGLGVPAPIGPESMDSRNLGRDELLLLPTESGGASVVDLASGATTAVRNVDALRDDGGILVTSAWTCLRLGDGGVVAVSSGLAARRVVALEL